VNERPQKASLGIRNRVLLWTLFISVTPLIAMYLLLGQVLESTGILIVKDAGDYADRKTRLLNSALRSDLETTLQINADITEDMFHHIYNQSGQDADATLHKFLTIIETDLSKIFVFDENDRMLYRPPVDEMPLSIDNRNEIVAFLKLNNYLYTIVPLEPTSWQMLMAVPVITQNKWQSSAQRFKNDFTGDVKAKTDQALSWLYLSALSLLVGLGLTALLLSRWLTKTISTPIETLAEAVESFDGITPATVMPERRDEIGMLTEKFNEMTNKLIYARHELATKKDALEKADRELMNLNLTLENRINARTANLQEALMKLRELDRNKDEFLGLVSHELKTPLTSISASAEALLSKDLQLTPEGRERFLHIIQSETERLGRLINDLLDMTRLEAGRMPFHFKRTDMADLIRQTVESFQVPIERKGLKLDLEIDEDTRLKKVMLDSDRFVQVLTNLLSNALKYTNRGRISVNLNMVTTTQKPTIRLVVADTGIGIQADDASKVFDRFQQIERFDTHHEGWGLGMPISRMLVESMGGEIHFASKPDHGTAFTVTLPLDGAPETEAPDGSVNGKQNQHD